MQSTFALSNPSTFTKPRLNCTNSSYFTRSLHESGALNFKNYNKNGGDSPSCLKLKCLWKNNSVPSVLDDDGKRNLKSSAISVPKEIGESSSSSSSKPNKFIRNVELGVLITFWYLLTTLQNIYNKQVLKDYPFPLTISAVQFGIGTVIVLLMWGFRVYKKPKITTSQLVAIVPLAMGHTLGNLFTNMSLGKVSVSFTHTIKAMEPFFSVILSALFLGEIPSFWVVSSLVPVVGGVALASFTEASFDWIGFLSAMASNLMNQSRNVFSKKFMIKKEEEYLDNITLFSIITIISFILTVPVALLVEGVKFTPMYLESAGLNFNEIFGRSLMAGLLYHAYQQIAYVILERVSPVTHSVSNCVKRIVLIVASVLFFKTPVSPINSIGTAVAIAGVFLFSQVKQMQKQKKE